MTPQQHSEQIADVPPGLLAGQHLEQVVQPALATERPWRMAHQLRALGTASQRTQSAPETNLFLDGLNSLQADLSEYDAISRDHHRLQALTPHQAHGARPPLLH